MGLENNIYLGPYVRAKPKLQMGVRSARRCSSGDCKIDERQAGAFCPACGASMENYEQETGRMISAIPIDVDEAINQALSQAFTLRAFNSDKHEHWEIWIPNYLRDAPRTFHMENYEEREFSFETVESIRQAEIVWLNTTFPKPLQVFKDHYLEVEIVWGLLTWAS